jgi:2-oxoglutarate/2-oxoacid ferredoxin oxidoreductase subunit beta
MFGLKSDWPSDIHPRYYDIEDYEAGEARWCPGCGDHAVLTAVLKICRDEQLPPEKTVAVSGIGCSSRFPHYLSTFGFHSLHGRAFPVACGIKSRRPDLKIWVATGDGDCCSIGAGHWVHAIRYNMDMTVMLFDNHIYGLTKNQTSPTSPRETKSNTHPEGSWLPPLNPLATTLSIANVSFVAQTVDWSPPHLQATLLAAYKHPGFSFVRILQRCPAFMKGHYEGLQNDPSRLTLLTHENGIALDPAVAKMYKNQLAHDPLDMAGARALAETTDTVPIGLLYGNPSCLRYDQHSIVGLDMTVEEKIRGLETELKRFEVV